MFDFLFECVKCWIDGWFMLIIVDEVYVYLDLLFFVYRLDKWFVEEGKNNVVVVLVI